MFPLQQMMLTSRRTMFSFAKKSLCETWRSTGQEISTPCQNRPGITINGLARARHLKVLSRLLNRACLLDVYFGKLTLTLTEISKQSEHTVALKIINSSNADDARDEKEIESHSTQNTSDHRGRVILRTCLDDFELNGPEGKHMCLVYEPMREPLWILQKRIIDHKLPLPIAKAYIYILLSDLKLGNILMSFENENVLSDFIKRQQPMQYKVDGESGRIIYRCQNDFGALDGRELKNMIPKIADFGLAARLDKPCARNGISGEQLGIYPIQTDYHRAPEVIPGCGWDFKADIWNFGVLWMEVKFGGKA
ncbi:hypothetical protein N7523_004669 [Penicillium sp. IBT 18751x]|nr:hypothetical protein N7523_004669 [Penicillium sp. IBT 18751x]